MGEFITVAQKSKVPQGEGLCVEANGKRLAIFNLEGQYYAIDDECTHAGGSLAEGSVDGQEVMCPWHGACFDIKTGEAKSEPASEAVKSYKVEIDGDDIKVEI